MFKFIHAADIHLDSPLRGLDRYEGVPADEIRQAARKAFQRLIDLAIQERVGFVVLAGDIYDGESRDFHTALFFNCEMARLHEQGIHVYVVAGNHDADARIRKKLARPANLHVLSTDRPETCALEEFGVAIHGQGFAKQAVTDDLAVGYPQALAGYFNIGVLHTALEGRQGHDAYAPCTIDRLLQKGYDYWALGHVHKRELVRPADPVVLFPGNVQGRHIREEGPKGCTLVSVDQGRTTSLEHRSLHVLRWARCEVDLDGGTDTEDVLERFRRQLATMQGEPDEPPLAVRVTFRGNSPALRQMVANQEKWVSEVRSAATVHGDGSVWVERVILDVTVPPGGQAGGGGPVPDELLRIIEELQPEMPASNESGRSLKELVQRLTSEMPGSWDGVDFSSPEQLSMLVQQGRALLLERLQSPAGDGRLS